MTVSLVSLNWPSAKVREECDQLSLENAVENHFTAKPPRAQRTYSKIKLHSFGEAIDHLNFKSVLSTLTLPD
jgi:hypothetical protein